MLNKGAKSGKFKDEDWSDNQANSNKIKFGKLYDEVLSSANRSERNRERGGKRGKDGKGKDRDDKIEVAVVSSLISILVTATFFMIGIYCCMRRNKKLQATAELSRRNRSTNSTPASHN